MRYTPAHTGLMINNIIIILLSVDDYDMMFRKKLFIKMYCIRIDLYYEMVEKYKY